MRAFCKIVLGFNKVFDYDNPTHLTPTICPKIERVGASLQTAETVVGIPGRILRAVEAVPLPDVLHLIAIADAAAVIPVKGDGARGLGRHVHIGGFGAGGV